MMEQPPPTHAALSSFATDASVARDLAVRDGGERIDESRDPTKAAVTVEHVADFTRRYPGEQVTFFTRVNIRAAIPGFSLRVHVPAGLEIDNYYASVDGNVVEGKMPLFLTVMEPGERELVMLPGPDGEPFPVRVPHQPTRAIEPTRPAQDMIWQVLEPQEAGMTYEYVVSGVVRPIQKDSMLHCTATLSVVDGESSENTETVASATASVALYRSGRYLEYLPSLYEQDDFMGRFLMLFESFWGPIDQQISSIHNYFDPDLTPPRFLPWLASWFDLVLDDHWSESQQRELLNSVIWLYRRRGTRAALQRYLEIFTQRPVEILEKRAKNLTLGSRARLGVGVALGTGNMPHTFTVKVQLRPITPPPDMDEEAAAAEVARLEKQRLELIHRMIMAEKPAHTSYRLEVVPVTE
jgi:phage tail-like protein